MNYYEIVGELVNSLQLILAENLPELDPDIVVSIKSDVHVALSDILVKYKIIEP